MSSTLFSYIIIVLTAIPVFFWFFHNRRHYELTFMSVFSLAMNCCILLILLFYFLIRFLQISQMIHIFWLLILGMYFFMLLNLKAAGLFGALKDIYFQMMMNIKKIFIFLCIFSVYFILVAFYLLKNGYDENGNLHLYNLFATEVIFHLSIVTQLDYHVFPQTLQFVSNSYQHYHYFADMFIHFFSSLTSAENNILLFTRFFVPLMLFALGVNVFSLTYLLFRKFSIAIVALCLSLFCYDLSAMIFWIKALFTDSNLWLSSHGHSILSYWAPLANLFQLFHNPPFLMSSVMFLGVLQVTILYFMYSQKIWLWLSVIGWVLLIKIKITVFLLGISGLLGYSIVLALRKKSFTGIRLFILIFFFSLPLLLITVGQNSNAVVFSKWFFLNNFALRNHFISNEEFLFIKNNGYVDSPRALLMFLVSSLLFIGGLLSFRILPLFQNNIFRKLKDAFQEIRITFFFLIIILTGIFSFLFFSAKIAPHDTMWFYLGVVFVLNVFAAKFVYRVFTSQNTIWNIIMRAIIAVFILFSALTFILPAVNSKEKVSCIIPAAKLKAFHCIKNESGHKRVLSRHYDMKEKHDEKNFLLTAFTGKPVIVEGLDYTVNFRTRNPDFMKQIAIIRADIEHFFNTSNVDSAKTIIDKYNVGFIYLEPNDTIRGKYEELTNIIFYEDGYTVLEIRE